MNNLPSCSELRVHHTHLPVNSIIQLGGLNFGLQMEEETTTVYSDSRIFASGASTQQSVPAYTLDLLQHLASFCSCKIMPPGTVLKLQNAAPGTAWKLLL